MIPRGSTSEVRPIPWWGHLRRLVPLVILLALGVLVTERWRGQRALRSWMQQHPEEAESLNLTSLWPKPEPSARQFQRALIELTRQLPADLTAFSGQVTGMVADGPGAARRGSQEPKPLSDSSKSWAQLDAAVTNNAALLSQLRQLLRHAPRAMADDIVYRMETDDMPAMTGVRISAQTLHAVAISELHHGNREGALENLLSLLSLTTVYEEEPALVNYMIRIAILGLSQDACWDALQDPGWTDAQLARLQQAVDTTRMLRQLPRVVEAERAARIAHWRSFREHSYRHWINRYGDLGKGFGIALPDFTRAPLAQRWREWGFHPLWQFAWADQEELDDLQQSQSTIAAVIDSVGCSSWKNLTTRVNEIERDYQPPAAQWRFHGHLPILDELSMVVGSPQSQNPRRSSLGHLRAWEVTFEHLTLHQLFVTAVALRRHAMRHGMFPETLNALVPALLTEPPVDYMDGAPLRYRRNKDGTFLLYSVGADSRDDGGDLAPKPGAPPNQISLVGSDWVWPRMASTHKQ